jgi:hypothetical protein
MNSPKERVVVAALRLGRPRAVRRPVPAPNKLRPKQELWPSKALLSLFSPVWELSLSAVRRAHAEV